MRARDAVRQLRSDRPLLRGLALAALLLGSIGLLAIGTSGALAAVLRAIAGDRFLAGDVPGVSYTAARCAELREYVAHTRSCLDAAATHHAGEVVDYRLAAGVLGCVTLAAWFALRRRSPGRPLPAAFVPTLAGAAFALAGLGLSALALQSLILDASGGGAGQWISAAVVAGVAAAACVRRLLATFPSFGCPDG